MSKRRRNPRKRSKQPGLSMVELVSIAVMGLIGYLAGELAYAARPHPVHWGVALLAASIGWGIGRLYYQLRGDIV